MNTTRDPSWLHGYNLATSGGTIICIPLEYDACQRIDFVDGILIGLRDRRNAELMDELGINALVRNEK